MIFVPRALEITSWNRHKKTTFRQASNNQAIMKLWVVRQKYNGINQINSNVQSMKRGLGISEFLN